MTGGAETAPRPIKRWRVTETSHSNSGALSFGREWQQRLVWGFGLSFQRSVLYPSDSIGAQADLGDLQVLIPVGT